jgi:hypothetical protein
MRARVRPRFFLESNNITERESCLSRFQYHSDGLFFVLSVIEVEVGRKAQRLCNLEGESRVSRPLMLRSMSEVDRWWKRIVPRRALVLQRVSVRRGLLERKEGMWTDFREMERMGVLVLSEKTSSLLRRIGVHGVGPANARDCVGDRSWGLECGGSGSGWIWGLLLP